MNSYKETLDFLYTQLPMFQKVGAGAYKPGLETAVALSQAFGSPHTKLRCIHVGGTNGKGSTSHTLAAILQSAGYKTGLFTSPHLVDFRERIRINGKVIPEQDVVNFVAKFREMRLDVEWAPSFFELTTIMAFDWFARENVDIAIIEVGLGGRLDTTNIIDPLVSIITNISFDHTQLLGDTLAAIAREKAGIIKPGVPAVIGEADSKEVRQVFEVKAASVGAPLAFAQDSPIKHSLDEYGNPIYHTCWGEIHGELCGDCQWLNANTVCHALPFIIGNGFEISAQDVKTGFENVVELTGLMGRWMKIKGCPTVVCDTGHNIGGWQYLGPRLAKEATKHRKLHMVIGFVNDKDLSHIFDYMLQADNVEYYFVTPSVNRGLDSTKLADYALSRGISGRCFDRVVQGYENALAESQGNDFIFVGGSTFVVADLLSFIQE